MESSNLVNYETWLVAKWLLEEHIDAVFYTAKKSVSGSVDVELCKTEFACELKSFVRGFFPAGKSISSRLCSASLARVDWLAIASHFIEESKNG